jgi:hypothetical protein
MKINHYHLNAAINYLTAASRQLTNAAEALSGVLRPEDESSKGSAQDRGSVEEPTGSEEPHVVFPDAVEPEKPEMRS